jgi:hypothetical protein
MAMKYARRLLVAALFILVSWNVYAQGDLPSQKIHSPAEIVKLMENSPLVYQIKELKTPVSQVRAGAALSNQLFIEAAGGTNKLQQYFLS